MIEFRDFLGNELKIDDKLIWLDHSKNSSSFRSGWVKAFTPKSIRVAYTCKYSGNELSTLKSTDKVIKR